MKYRKLFIIFIISMMVYTNTIIVMANAPKKERIRDLLGLDKNMEIIIEEVYYRKDKVPPVEEGQKIIISINDLKNMLLNNAIVVSGEEINYMFNYETVIISGKIKTSEETYRFRYNLAGFGVIFLTGTEYIQYGDMTQMLYE